MKRLAPMMSCALLVSFIATGCKKDEAKKDEPAKTDPAATKPAEMGKEGTAAPATPPAAVDPAAAAGGNAAPAPGAPGAPSDVQMGGAAPAAVAPVEPPAAEKELAEKAIVMLEEMAGAAEANAADCTKAAAALQGIVDKNKALIEAGKKMDNDPGKKAWFDQKYEARMKGAMTKMMPLVEKCKDNPELLKVFSTMQ